MIAVLATANPGKLRELRPLLAGTGLCLKMPSECGFRPPTVRETGKTFEENALIKARAFAAASGLPALADDSGLEVAALGGAPGVRSARYGGPGATDRKNCLRLLSALRGVKRRSARFRCVLVLAGPSGKTLIAEGSLNGAIALSPRGRRGFGYDPVFRVPSLNRTLAQLTFKEKQKLSHRARAARKLGRILKRRPF